MLTYLEAQKRQQPSEQLVNSYLTNRYYKIVNIIMIKMIMIFKKLVLLKHGVV